MAPSRYLRLMILSISIVTFAASAGVYNIYRFASSGLKPWVSWDDAHSTFSTVRVFTAASWRAQSGLPIAVEATRWLPVVSALLYFLLFAFSSEARKQYNLISYGVLGYFGLNRWRSESRKAGLPSWAKPLKLGKTSIPEGQPPPYKTSASQSTFDAIIHSVELCDIERNGHSFPPPYSTSLIGKSALYPLEFESQPQQAAHDFSKRREDIPSSLSSSSLASSSDHTIAEPSTKCRDVPKTKPTQSSEGSPKITLNRDWFFKPDRWRRSQSPSPVPFTHATMHAMSQDEPQITHESTEYSDSRSASGLDPVRPSPRALSPPPDGILITVHTVSVAGR
ncbi:hypothetical protein H1R20_g8607, partial [Candolleomyces eurysporus]